MRTIQTDLTVLDNILALNLNITLWSARRKMTPEDFGGVKLPPEDLATLGSKRIADPDKLKIFNTLKARAFNFLDKHGVRFMSGWAIPEQKAGSITEELIKIRDEFHAAKNGFLAEYDENLNDWIDRHSCWASIIRDSVVSSEYVRSRLDFRWQIFRVSPLLTHENAEAVAQAGLAQEVEGLGNTLFAELARSADEIWKKVYMGKNEVTHKALSPLRTLHEKLMGLTFIEPHVAPVAEIISSTLKQMPVKGNIGGNHLVMLQGLVCLLRNSEDLLLHAQKLIEGHSAASVLANLEGSAAASDFDAQIEVEGVTAIDDLPDLPDIPQIPTKTVLPNLGLW